MNFPANASTVADTSEELFSYVDLEKRVRADHPLQAIRSLTDAELSQDFLVLYSGLGRPSIVPEMLLREMLLQAFYSVRSERHLMERLEFDLLFRRFVGLGTDDVVWDHSTFEEPRPVAGWRDCSEVSECGAGAAWDHAAVVE